MRILILFLFISSQTFGQNEQILVLGNHRKVCLKDRLNVTYSDTLPNMLNKYRAILLFSNSTSKLTKGQIEDIVSFIELGGGLYSGAENWPLQAESNQMTDRIYQKQSFGEYSNENAKVNDVNGNLALESDNIPAGNTTVAFPMDYRLKVEAWVDDQPLLLSGKLKKGRIIIDGGYSRFYCDLRSSQTDDLLNKIIAFLIKD